LLDFPTTVVEIVDTLESVVDKFVETVLAVVDIVVTVESVDDKLLETD